MSPVIPNINNEIVFIGPKVEARNKWKRYYDIAQDAEKYEKHINKMRADAGLPPMEWDYEFERNINDLMG